MSSSSERPDQPGPPRASRARTPVVVATLAIAGLALALAIAVRRDRPAAAPATVHDALAARAAAQRAAHAREIGDTTRIGRVLIFPTANTTGDTTLDGHLRLFDEGLRLSLASGFTPLVPAEEVTRLLRRAAAERRPTTSELQAWR